jgi:hypothetical protein
LCLVFIRRKYPGSFPVAMGCSPQPVPRTNAQRLARMAEARFNQLTEA